VRFAFVDAEKAHYPVRMLCRLLRVSRAGFYAWRRQAPSSREREDVRLGVEVAAIHAESKRRYGSPRVHDELRDRGHRVGRKRVARLMRERGLRARGGRRRRPRTTNSRHGLPVAANLLGRHFRVDEPNVAWVGDITYLPTAEGWLYLAVLLDLFSRRVVGYALSEHIDTALVQEALQRALALRQPREALLHHTDRGSQYASHGYRETLDAHGLVPSMSRRGDCYDNAVAESFFSTLEMELVVESEWATRAEAATAVRAYIDGFYNPVRRHTTLGSQSPIEFERRHAAGRKSGGSAPAPPQKMVGVQEEEEKKIGAGRRAA
jgi:transposase InsO family protein